MKGSLGLSQRAAWVCHKGQPKSISKGRLGLSQKEAWVCDKKGSLGLSQRAAWVYHKSCLERVVQIFRLSKAS